MIMISLTKTMAFLVILLCLSALTFVKSEVNGIDGWCDRTPYPKQCKHFMGRSLVVPRRESEFMKMMAKVAADRVFVEMGRIRGLGARCHGSRELAAWADCLKLYQTSVVQINSTIDPNIKKTPADIETWLSAVLTNFVTCRNGFVELGVTNNILPLTNDNNVTKLVSNTLALANNSTGNQTLTGGGGGGEGEFPTWVSPGDRKLLQSASPVANLVVAKDGSGNFNTIKAALDAAAARNGNGRFVIRIKPGIYNENLEIGSKLKNIMLLGDGLKKTIITGNRSVGGGFTTFNSATVAVVGTGFIAQGITFQNTAGAENHQAVALRSGADLSVFYRCSFEGYQDTLYVHSQRQFYRECYIYGTVDFIFGNAAVVLQNCMIYARKPMDKQKNTVTAQGRTDPNQNTGISIHNSRVMAGPDLVPVVGSFKTYLGRPWKQYSRTVLLKCFLDSLVDPAGWLEWDGNFALDTLEYGEYRNFGPGSSTSGRVNWKGYKVISNASEALKYSVGNFIDGRSWLPATNVTFTSCL